VGNQGTFWDPISANQKEQLSLILHELMVNMKKHSWAKNVILLFSLKQHKALITYKDDGKGFEPDQQNGNGLNNTVNRIFLMKGDITFGKSEKGGASISISLPLERTKI
jgi:signal transduction histidine kinase